MTDIAIQTTGQPTRQIWRAPRLAYMLAAAMAADDADMANALWKMLGEDDKTDVIVALGAQARQAVQQTQSDPRRRVIFQADMWNLIICADVLTFTVSAYRQSENPLPPAQPCKNCLRIATQTLVRLYLTALEALGIPHDQLSAYACGLASRSR